MGVSTDGQICYGILLDEEVELPWGDDKYDDGIYDWWVYTVKGYEPPFEMFDDDGEYIGGESNWTTQQIDHYFEHLWLFRKQNPLPVELVNVCSNDYPIYIIAAPETCVRATRGYPLPFEPSQLDNVSLAQKEELIKFCDDYEIEYDGEPQWYLSSYWG